MVVQEASLDAIRTVLADRTPAPAVVYGLRAETDWGRGVDTTRVRILGVKDKFLLGHLPRPFAEEIEAAIQRTPVAARFSNGIPVSFCYAGSLTETLWDVSIDTLEGERRKGFAGECAVFMTRLMKNAGKNPVWGSMETNQASNGLAIRLGFTPVDRLYIYAENPAR
jgi:hypothetical protein